MTWDRDRLALYVDAAEQGTRSAGSIHVTDAFAGIGARSEEGFEDDELALEFTGEIDEVMFFGRALDPAEIRAVYETTAGHRAPRLRRESVLAPPPHIGGRRARVPDHSCEEPVVEVPLDQLRGSRYTGKLLPGHRVPAGRRGGRRDRSWDPNQAGSRALRGGCRSTGRGQSGTSERGLQ